MHRKTPRKMWPNLLVAAAGLLLSNAQAVNETDSLSCIVESTGVHIPGTIPCNPYEPLQHRLAYAGTNGMTVSWSTYAQLQAPQVFYGESPFDLSAVATGYSVTYPTSRVYDNHVKITGLKANTKYWYRVAYQLSFILHSLPVFSTHASPCAETALGVLTGRLTPS